MELFSLEYTCSLADKNLHKRIAKEVLSSYKRASLRKRIPLKLVIYLETALKASLSKRFAYSRFSHRFSTGNEFVFSIYVCYNYCKVVVYEYREYSKKREITSPTYIFDDKDYALGACYEKYLLFGAKYIYKTLTNLYPDYKFPDPDSNVELYRSIWIFGGGEEDFLLKLLSKSSSKLGNNLYLEFNTLLIVSNKEDYVCFVYDDYKHMKCYPNLYLYDNSGKMSNFIAELLGICVGEIFPHLENDSMVEDLKKLKILNSIA